MKIFHLPPIYPVTALFTLGIFAAHEHFVLFAVLASIIVLLTAPSARSGFVYMIVFVVGFLNLSMRSVAVSSYPEGAVIVSGEVELFPKKDSFVMRTERGKALVWHGGGEKLEGGRKSLPGAGDIVSVEGLFTALSEKKNSFSTDWKRINEAQGIGGRIFAKKIEVRGHPSGFKKFIVRLRTAADNGIEKYFGSDSAAYVRGFLWGEKSGLEKDIIKNFRRAGLMHLLAVSGLHIALFTSIAAVFLSFFMSRGNALLMSVPLAFLYALLCGATPSSVRAALMFSIMALGLRSGRRGALGSSLFAAAFFMLILNPLWLFTAGFRLSYLAAAGIIFISPPLFRIFKKIMPGFIAAPLAVGIACQIMIIPVLNETFYEFSIITPVMNLVVIPIAALLVFALFSFFCTVAVSSWAAGVFASSATLFVTLIDKILRATVLVPNAMAGWGHLSVFTYAAYYALIFSFLSKRLRIVAAAFLLFLTAIACQLNSRREFRLCVPAFGSGDCCFFTSSGKWYQIGTASDIAGKMAAEYDQFIKYHGIKEIEGCFILTSSVYHTASFKELMDKNLVKKFHLRIGIKRTADVENLLYDGRGRGLFRDFREPFEEGDFRFSLSGEALLIEAAGRKIVYAFGEDTRPGPCDVFIGDVYEFCKYWLIPQFEDKEVIIRLGRKVLREGLTGGRMF